MDYSTDRFLKTLYEKSQKIKTLLNCAQWEINSLIEKKRKKLKEVLGLDKLYHLFPDFKPDFILSESEQRDNYSVLKYDWETLPNLIVPFYVLKPDKQPSKAVVYCHGHGYGAAETLDASGGERYHNYLPLKLADEGYAVYMPEFIGFGDAVFSKYNNEKECGCYANSTNLLLHGLNIIGIRVNQVLQAIELANLNYDNISLFGVSGGGMAASFTSAIENKADSVCIASYANTFKSSIMPMRHCIDNYVFDVLSVGELPEILSLSAPKRLLITSGDKDPIFPDYGVKEAFKYIEGVYNRLGVSDRIELCLFNGKHEVYCEPFIKWLGKT